MQGVGLHQQAVEINPIQQLAQGRDLASGIGGVGVLGNRYPKGVAGLIQNFNSVFRLAAASPSPGVP